MKSKKTHTVRIVAVCGLALSFTVVGGGQPAEAGIIATGDINPAYNFTDPWLRPNSTITVGVSGVGEMTVDGTSAVGSSSGVIGNQNGSTGTVTISGVGSSWDVEINLRVGGSGAGSLTIENGASVSALRDTTVGGSAGLGSALHLDNGTLNAGGLVASFEDLMGTGVINATGLVSDIDLVFDSVTGVQQQMILNSIPGQNITLNIDASDPAENGVLGAGFRGIGSLTIDDGLVVTSGRGRLGVSGGSLGTATVKGAGSTWTINGDLDVGFGGTGILNIEDGGSVIADSVGLGVEEDGTVNVDGSGAELHSGNLSVGSFLGTGVMTIDHGGAVHADEILITGLLGTATLHQIDGDVHLEEGIRIGNNGTYNLLSGTLDMNESAIADGAHLGAGDFNFDGGTVKDASLIDLGEVFEQRGGTLEPSNSAGETTIIGGYTLAEGTIQFELESTGFDQIHVMGAVDLLGSDGLVDGEFDLVLGFSPPVGQVFTVISNDGADPVVGTFVQGTTVFAQNGSITHEFELDYAGGDGNDITLTVISPCLADINGNGETDTADLGILIDQFSTSGPEADINGDGVVDTADLGLLLASFGCSL